LQHWPPKTPLFIFIDAVSYYETGELSNDTKKVSKAIKRLVTDRNVKAMVKVFVTSAHRALDVGVHFEQEGERVFIPENPTGVRLGFVGPQFQLAFGQKIATVEESSREQKKS
jgi:hypothetical protein